MAHLSFFISKEMFNYLIGSSLLFHIHMLCHIKERCFPFYFRNRFALFYLNKNTKGFSQIHFDLLWEKHSILNLFMLYYFSKFPNIRFNSHCIPRINPIIHGRLLLYKLLNSIDLFIIFQMCVWEREREEKDWFMASYLHVFDIGVAFILHSE